MWLYILKFIAGFIFLIKGADLLIDGSLSIAKKARISSMAIGLTIVSFGTSLPELVVSMRSNLTNNSGIAVGNVLGSNVSNIMLVLGVAALICHLPIRKHTIVSDIPFSIIAITLVGFLANVSLFRSEQTRLPSLSRIDGFILIFFLLLFFLYILYIAREHPDEHPEATEESSQKTSKSLIMIGVGSVGLFFGGDWVVEGAVFFANIFGWSQSFIGLTVIALGTSLPELVTSIIAASKKEVDIAVGNVVGSNIFNLLLILGFSATIKPLPFAKINNTDIGIVLLASTLMLVLILIGKKRGLTRWKGAIFVLGYIGYIIYLIQRDSLFMSM